ncbi:MAG: pantoate--beta-alanine ligase [Acidimicrobiales bacterium]
MKQLSSIEHWRDFAHDQRRAGHSVGLVPTMGALHAGHTSLFDEAKSRGDVVIATIFVNPRQFGDPADLRAYPRTPEMDVRLAQAHGVDCLVQPSLEEMWPDYPAATATTVSVRGVSDVLEGAGRPGHFDGVASVVAKLFAVTGPCRAYFGEKDFQQMAVVRRMVEDLALPVEVVGCPIVRDDDGLALSSRNLLLSEPARRQALALSQALRVVSQSHLYASEMRRTMRALMQDAGVRVAYTDVVDPITFVPTRDDESGPRRALVAGVVDGVRLIDNAPVVVESRRD